MHDSCLQAPKRRCTKWSTVPPSLRPGVHQTKRAENVPKAPTTTSETKNVFLNTCYKYKALKMYDGIGEICCSLALVAVGKKSQTREHVRQF